MNGRTIIKYTLEAVIGGGLLAGALFLYLRPDAQKEDTKGTENELPAVVETIQFSTLKETLFEPGTASSWQSVELSSQVAETLTKVHFKDGQKVTEGMLLFEFENREETAKVENLTILLADAKREYERFRRLQQANAVSAKDFDTQKTKMDVAEMELKALRLALDDRKIVAPFPGYIGICNVTEGAYIKQGTPLVTLDDDSKIKVDFNVPEKYALKIHEGMPFTVTGDAFSGQTLAGTVSSMDSRIDVDTRTLKVRGMIDNPKRILRSGMLLNVTLALGERRVLMIPEKAVVVSGERREVFTVSSDGFAHKKTVELGLRRDGRVEVVSGLEAGEKLIVEGASKAKDGKPVNVAREEQK